MVKTLVVAGIGTDVGKTVVSAALSYALDADYWKPIQAGELNNSDSRNVQRLGQRSPHQVHAEQFRLTQAMSPHAAAQRDGVNLSLDQLTLPTTENILVIELAGGLMVPLNDHELMLHWLQTLKAPVMLVCSDYLGSINHTLLSIKLLQMHGVPLLGLAYTGTANTDSREVVAQHTGLDTLIDLPHAQNLTPDWIATHAQKIRQHPRLAEFR